MKNILSKKKVTKKDLYKNYLNYLNLCILTAMTYNLEMKEVKKDLLFVV